VESDKWVKSSFSNGSGGNNCVEVKWKKAQRCGTSTCVEVAKVEDEFWLRDSKDPNGPVLKFTMAEWDAFVQGVAAGEFNYNKV
jgi:hypothetical protein